LAILEFELGKWGAILPQHFNFDFPYAGICINKQVPPVEGDRVRCQGATLSSCIHRRETIASQSCKPSTASGVHVLTEAWRYAGESAEVKAQFITDDEADATTCMKIASVPGTWLT
jgi:hypothetical protein